MSQIVRIGTTFLNFETLGHAEFDSEPDGKGGLQPVAYAHTLGGRVRLAGADAEELRALLDAYATTEAAYRAVEQGAAAAPAEGADGGGDTLAGCWRGGGGDRDDAVAGGR